ncbi:MAG: hypothetical protein MJ179_02675 [Treponema sp.]|nr:hypothetical protein [Treponema sp.]
MELKAKTVSLVIKIIDVAFIVTMAILKWCGLFQNITVGEICIVGGVIASVFGDVSLNTAIDKFTKGKEIE